MNSIAIEVPIFLLTRTGAIEPATSTAATIGVWATTSRPRVTVRRAPFPAASSGEYHRIQRMGNPLVNELLIGTGSKDRFSMDQPKNDSQFASFLLDPTLPRVLNALTAGASLFRGRREPTCCRWFSTCRRSPRLEQQRSPSPTCCGSIPAAPPRPQLRRTVSDFWVAIRRDSPTGAVCLTM